MSSLMGLFLFNFPVNLALQIGAQVLLFFLLL